MSEVPDDRQLFIEATDLAIRLQDDPGDEASVEKIKAWVAQSPEHARMWARVCEIHGMAGKVLFDRWQARDRGKLSRRTVIKSGMLGLASVGTGYLVIPGIIMNARADHRTGTGEIQAIELSNSSMIALGPETAIAIDSTDDETRIDLLSGMAYFQIASDFGHRLEVVAGPLTATTLDAVFEVSIDAGNITVFTESGSVDSRIAGPVAGNTEQLDAGSWITLDSATNLYTRGIREAAQVARWRDGLLVAENETVSTLVAKISRWHRGMVLIVDPGLETLRVSGVFDLSDPLDALRAVVSPFGGNVREFAGVVTITSIV